MGGSGDAGRLTSRPKRARPGAVLLLTALALAFALAFFPDYWDWDLRRLHEDLHRDMLRQAQISGSIAANDQERVQKERDRVRALAEARERARLEGSIRGLFEHEVTDLAQDREGRILAAGIHSVQALALARLRRDGSLDADFSRCASVELAGILDGAPSHVAVLPDGKIVVAGALAYERHDRALVRFLPDGTLDAAFHAASAVLGSERIPETTIRLDVEPDGSLIVASHRFGEPLAPARVRSDGRIDEQWPASPEGLVWVRTVFGLDGRAAPMPAALADVLPASRGEQGRLGPVHFLGVQPDGRALLLRWTEWTDETGVQTCGAPSDQASSLDFVCGNDERFRPVAHLVRVAGDGTIEVMDLGTRQCAERLQVSAIAFQPDGGIVMAGKLPQGSATQSPCEIHNVWRVDAGGRIDPAFRKTSQGAEDVRRILVLADGGIVLGGRFTSVQGRPRRNIALLRADGTVDES